MKLLVLGATGGTGLEIVRQAVDRGHHVTAFVRSPEKLKPFDDRINIRQGDLLDSTQLEQVIQVHEAVLSGFGPRVPISRADAHLLQRFATALTEAMLHTVVRRVVVESVAFLFKDSIMPPTYLSTPAENGADFAGLGRSQLAVLEWSRESPGWRGRSKNSKSVSILRLDLVSILLRAPASSRNPRSRLDPGPPLSLLPRFISAFHLPAPANRLQ
jgi:hypothetical protein